MRISLAGDLNQDGNVDGFDSQLFEQGDPSADLDGNGQINATDRQILYANYGWKANQAPGVHADIPTGKTHTDLDIALNLNTIADDLEGDAIFSAILNLK